MERESVTRRADSKKNRTERITNSIPRGTSKGISIKPRPESSLRKLILPPESDIKDPEAKRVGALTIIRS